MQYKLLALAFAALAAAAGPLVERAAICPAGETPSCCQTTVDDVADLTCDPGMSLVTSN